MEARQTVTKDMVRNAMMALGEGGKEVSHSLVYEALGLKEVAEQDVVRKHINNMCRHGEVRRVERGLFVYDFARRPRESKCAEVLWRFVRKAKPGWSISECALMTRVSYTRALRYCNWLAEEGFIAPAGKDERNAVIWRSTTKADMHPETPYPPVRETDPFARERAAAATIARLMLCADPYAKKTAHGILEACNVLQARFSRPMNENNEITEE